MLERSRFCPVGLVVEDDLARPCGGSSPTSSRSRMIGRVELDLREDRRVGPEEHGRAGAARRAELLHGRCRLALLEPLLPLRAVALDGGDQLLRQRVDDAGADAVEAAGGLVVALLELPAGVEHREDHLERALLRLRVLVHRDAAPVVRDGDGGAVGVKRHRDVRCVAVHRLVDGVVEDLPDEMVQPGGRRRRRCTCRDACGRARALRER